MDASSESNPSSGQHCSCCSAGTKKSAEQGQENQHARMEIKAGLVGEMESKARNSSL